MKETITFLCIVYCFCMPIEAIHGQNMVPDHLLPQEISGKQVPSDQIKAPVVTILNPPIQIKSGPPQVISQTTIHLPIGPLKSKNISLSSQTLLKKGSADYPQVSPLIHQPFLAGKPEKVLAKPMLKKNTGPDVVLTYDLSNGLKDITIQEMYQDKQHNLWATTVYGGAFKFDGKYFHYIAEAQGLPSNTVLNMLFTSDEEIWFGTLDGLARYDGKYMTNYTSESGLLNSWITGLEEDRYGNIWVLTQDGLQMIDKINHTIYTFNLNRERHGKLFGRMKKDANGNIWVGHEDNTLNIIFIEQKGDNYEFKVNYYQHDLGIIRQYHEDHLGNMWAVTTKSFYKFALRDNDYKIIIATDYDQVMKSASHTITSIDQDDKNNILISTRRSGVFILDPNIDAPTYQNLTGPYDIPDTFVSGIFSDDQHNIWMASGGLTLIKKTPYHIFDRIKSPTSMVEDFQKNRWIAADRGLYKYNPLSPDTILLYGKKEGLPNTSISDLIIDKNGNIWIATLGDGLVIFEPDAKNQKGIFKHYPREGGIPSQFVTKFIEDKNKDIWFSSYENSAAPTSGVAKINGNEMTFIGLDQGLIHEDVMTMDYDVNGNFWIGSWGLGINKYEPESNQKKTKVTHFTSKFMPIENRVRSVKADRNGNIWTGGFGSVGITQFLPSKNDTTEKIRHYSLTEGLSSTNLLSILDDQDGNLWFGTAYGLNFLSADQISQPKDNRPIVSFTIADGFPARTCKNNVLFQFSDSMIWVGGDDRLIYFDPKELIKENKKPTVFLKEISLFNQAINWKKDTTFVLNNGKIVTDFSFDSLSYFNHLPIGLQLTYDNNFIDFDYAAGTASDGYNFTYQTILEGLEENWGSRTTETKISYNGLSHGQYIFKVRAKIENGAWGKTVAYPFKIFPPWWLTGWAYTLYAIFGIILLITLYRVQLKRNLEKAEALRLVELDNLKTRLYTNITHEFRTPLTVISGMSSHIKDDPQKWLKDGIPMIERNSTRLLNLVNQMLDLSKLESGKIKLQQEQGNMIAYLKYLIESIHSFAESEKIQLHFLATEDEVIMDYDPQKIEQIIINLLSNAVKFSPIGGNIYLSTKLIQASNKRENSPQVDALEISIRDNGPGIPAAEIPFIFDRFYQVDDSSTRREEGSGIGLAFVKELISLMKGKISVKSKLGKETIFKIILPITNHAPITTASVIEAKPTINGSLQKAVSSSTLENNKNAIEEKLVILLIEDNQDIVAYIAACLIESYEIKVGKNGQEGIEIALENIPDLIVTDVMMPVKDGFDVCNTLKNDERTCHIPIIMLTAKADIESKLIGLEKGADAYLSKPFHKEELLIRIRKLLELRKKLQNHYLISLGIKTDQSLSIPKPEALMVSDPLGQKLKEIIELNLDDYDFTVEKLSKEIGMSRSQLQRKLSALTGLSPNKFIRQVRLSNAKRLLQYPDTTISEVAFRSGFNDPSYFGRVFKKEFGLTPVEWKAKVIS